MGVHSVLGSGGEGMAVAGMLGIGDGDTGVTGVLKT